ncbi:NUDIX hydrolase [Fontimonas thermophila]|nr:NUDIX hydrolase [Fontimonas thermophila]
MHAEIRYCNVCGQPVEFRIPPGDHLPRHVCTRCGHVQYRNPKVIVGVIPEWGDGRVLMCRRNIEPRLGLWTFPAGFMEQGETSAAGAAREAREESRAEVEVGPLLMVINVPYVSQVYMIHRGRLLSPHFGPTPESSEVVLMAESEIPWDKIAFPTIWHGLRAFFEDRRRGVWTTHVLDLTQRPRPPRQAEVPGDDPVGDA